MSAVYCSELAETFIEELKFSLIGVHGHYIKMHGFLLGFFALVNILLKCFPVSGCWSPRPESCRRMETVRGAAVGRCIFDGYRIETSMLGHLLDHEQMPSL